MGLLAPLAALACGGGSPAAPSPPVLAATPVPTPPPRVTFSLSAPADHLQYSPAIQPLLPGQSFEILFTPTKVDDVPGHRFALAVEIWLRPDELDILSPASSVGFSFGWYRDEEWWLSMYYENDWHETLNRVRMPLGGQRGARVVRRPDGTADLFLDGNLLMTIAAPEPRMILYTRVVGADATFSYQPGMGGAGFSAPSGGPGTGRCGPCLIAAMTAPPLGS